MKMLKITFCLLFALLVEPVFAGGEDKSVDTFAEIYEKLDSVKWGGKSIDVAIEGLENLNPHAHLAATDDRVILVWRDTIIGNFQKPELKDWQAYGKITVALIDKMRERDGTLSQMSQEDIYENAVAALMRGINESGKYIPKKNLLNSSENRILTSMGLSGWRDRGGEYRVETVVKGSPADLAGIQVDDLIDRVNGRDVVNIPDEEMDAVFNGMNSGTAKLHLLTPTGNRDVVVRRATIMLADADIVFRPMDKEGILEIIVHEMTDNAVKIAEEALGKYSNATGVVLDLRVARGNDARAATKLAGLFVGKKPVMRVAQDGSDDMEFVPGIDAATDARLVVLVSNNTSGTPEAVASAIYENGRGVLVGTPTAGDARISTRLDLSNGAVLELLDKSIKSNRGVGIDKRGIFPIVCLSNIRSVKQQNAFFINVVNDDFNVKDFNKDDSVDVNKIRMACPIIANGEDEDMVSAAVATKILIDKNVYHKLIAE